MKKILSLLSCAILTLSIKAQSDTIIANGVTEIGIVTTVKVGLLQLQRGNETFNFPVHRVSRVAISPVNPNKRQLETAYLYFLDQPEQDNRYSAAYTPRPFDAGYYMERGANRQIAGIIVAAGSLLVGGGIIAASKNPTPGLVVIGTGDLIGFILNLCGIADFKTAGQLLNRK